MGQLQRAGHVPDHSRNYHYKPCVRPHASRYRRHRGRSVRGDVATILGITPARIAEEGFLDQFATRRGQEDIYFTHVGYGEQGIRPRLLTDLARYTGISSLVNLRSAWTDGFNLQTTANPGHGRSGICFGDSGGPVFFKDTDVIVAIHSFVKNDNCKGTGFSYRIDTSTAQEFLALFGVTP